MVCNLTIGKKKYTDVEDEIKSVKEKLEKYRTKFIELGNDDNIAFNKVMEAMKLPKNSESEKEIRLRKIEEATIGAAEVPTTVILICKELLPLLKIISENGNKNSLSDAGVAIALLAAAVQGANLNVLINCSSFSNQTIAGEIRKRTEILTEEILRDTSYLSNQIIKSVSQIL